MTGATPQADVVVPSYNAGSLLSRAVRSALALACVARVIVVDDGSAAPEVLEADLLPAVGAGRVMMLRQENGGPSAARNRALREVTAAYAVFLDADDALLPGIADAIRFAHERHAAAVVSGRVDVAPNGGRAEKRPPRELAGTLIGQAAEVWRPIALFGMPGVVLARSVIAAGVRFDADIRCGEDRQFLHRVLAAGEFADGRKGLGVCDALVVAYTISVDGTSLSGAKNLPRMVSDYGRLTGMYCDARSHGYFAAQWRWFAAQAARHGAPHECWENIVRVCAERAISVPVKVRLRRWWRGAKREASGK